MGKEEGDQFKDTWFNQLSMSLTISPNDTVGRRGTSPLHAAAAAAGTDAASRTEDSAERTARKIRDCDSASHGSTARRPAAPRKVTGQRSNQSTLAGSHWPLPMDAVLDRGGSDETGRIGLHIVCAMRSRL